MPTRRVPYSRNPEDLLHPGRATDLFDPDFGAIPSEAALCSEMSDHAPINCTSAIWGLR